jgi:hypothetical protein
MKTLQTQYNLIKEGKGDKAYFMKLARYNFPDLVTPVLSYKDTITVLKNKSILSEGIGGLVTTGKKQDWHAIFNENMANIKEYGEDSGGQDMTSGIYSRSSSSINKGKEDFMDDVPFEACPYENGYNKYYKADLAKLWQMGWKEAEAKAEDQLPPNTDEDMPYMGLTEAKVGDVLKHKSTGAEFKITKISGNSIEGKYTKLGGMEGKVKVGDTNKTNKNLIGKTYDLISEAKEAKAVEKETTKEVTDMATRGYDYKDPKNYDNVFGEEFLKGFYTEMGDPKNEGKTVEELRAIVAKNLAKDISHYVKDGQFGVKGVGYQTEAPGLGTPKEAKGKFKSSGYGDLKESVLRSQIYLLVKEVLAEVSPDSFSKYSDSAIADMIVNLSRFKDNEDEIQDLKKELTRRKKTKNESKKK